MWAHAEAAVNVPLKHDMTVQQWSNQNKPVSYIGAL